MGFLRDGLDGLHSLFFPTRCPYCLLEGVSGCVACLDQWRTKISIRYVEKVPILSMHPYEHRAMSIVLAAKERGERDARTFLSVAIRCGIEAIAERISRERELIIVTIPASKRAIRQRGEDFLQETIKTMNLDTSMCMTWIPLLHWRRDVRDQSSLTLQERLSNLRDSLAVDEGLVSLRGLRSSGARVILIDDVLTTGATMSAAISAISHSSLGAPSLIAGVTACYSVNPGFA